MSQASPSLRARSKAKRRDAIQRAGLLLFARNGYESTTIADIAAEADVAPRTVTMHFPNKIDIATSAADELAVGLTATLRANPQSAFSDIIEQWLDVRDKSVDVELATLTTTMYDANPALRARSTTHVAVVNDLAGRALRTESGLTEDDLMFGIVGAAVSAVLFEYLTLSSAPEPGVDVRAAFIGYLRAIIRSATPTVTEVSPQT